MIKFTAVKDGKLLIGLGLSEENIKRLRKGNPIVVDLADLGITFKAEVFIFTGKNEKTMKKDLEQFIAFDTVTNT
jgi:hypothetical protein